MHKIMKQDSSYPYFIQQIVQSKNVLTFLEIQQTKESYSFNGNVIDDYYHQFAIDIVKAISKLYEEKQVLKEMIKSISTFMNYNRCDSLWELKHA